MTEDDLFRKIILMSDQSLTNFLAQITEKTTTSRLHQLAIREAERRLLDIDLPYSSLFGSSGNLQPQ